MNKLGVLFLLRTIFPDFQKNSKPIWSLIVLKIWTKMGENSDQIGTNVVYQKNQFGASNS